MYQYFEDIEYGNDDYMDPEDSWDDDSKIGDKRKRGSHGFRDSDKRKRIKGVDYPPVLWRPMAQAYSLESGQPVDVKSLRSYSLLADWRERLKDARGFSTATTTKAITAKIKKVNALNDGEEVSEAEESDDEEEFDDGEELIDGEENGEGEWEDEEEGGESDQDMEEQDGLGAGLDPALLRGILAAKGIQGADQAAFMDSLMQMVQGGGEAGDDLLESLTSTLLGRASEGGADSSTTQWLSQNGVALTEEEEDEEEEEADTAKALEPENTESASKSRPETDSPKDSVAETDTISKNTLPPTSAPQEDLSKSKKRKKVSFVPDENENATVEEEEQILTSRPRGKRTKLEPGAELAKSSTGKLKNAKPAPASTIGNKKGSRFATSMEIPSDSVESAKETSVQANKTRKRKASAPDLDSAEEKPMKQMRGGFAAPTASSQRKVSEPTKKSAGPAKKTADPMKKTTRSGKKRE